MATNEYYEDDEDFFDEENQGAMMGYGLRQGGQGGNELLPDNEAYAQQRLAEAAAQQEQSEIALAAVPDPVKGFIMRLHQAIIDKNVLEIQQAYEQHWNRLTEKFFTRTEWPQAEIISPLVNGDDVFLMFYRELYFRHVYSRLSPDLDDRFHSYENYCAIFNWVLNSDGPVSLEMPPTWLYDIIDEFVYQFQSFVTWRSRVAKKTEEEIVILGDNPQVWSCYSVLNVLYSLIQKSKIQQQLPALRSGSIEEADEIGADYGSKPLYRWLGYFSIIGLLRVHVLLGDYTLALKMMDDIELNKKAMFARVLPCHVSVYYYVGFSYMMLRRYADAIRIFSILLGFLMRLKHFHTRGYQYDSVNKMADRMYALLAISHALCPTKTDDSVLHTMREKNGEQYSRMVRGGEDSLDAFKELYNFGSPKFISPNPPPYDDPAQLPAYATQPDVAAFQLKIFLDDIKAQLSSPTLRSFLKLYTTLGVDKLATFMGVEEEQVIEELMVMKNGMRSVRWTEGKTLLEGEVGGAGDLDFSIDHGLVTVIESRIKSRFGDYFLRNALKFQDALDSMSKKPLPTKPKPNPPAPAQQAVRT